MKKVNKTLAFGVAAAIVTLTGFVTVSQAQIQNLTNGLVAYWPMDRTNAFGEVPELVHGYNFKMYFKDRTPTNRWAEDTLLITNDAVRGNAVYWPFFTGSPPRVTGGNNTNATGFFLAYVAGPNDKIPISRWNPTNWTISMWVKLGDNHPYQDIDQRIWCEGNSGENWPTLNISVTGPGELRFFERGLLGQGTRANNGVRIYNDEQTNTWTGGNGWRNLTIVQRQDEGQAGTAANRYIFVDGYLVAGPGTAQPINGKLDGIINNLNNFSLGSWYRTTVPDVAFLTNAIIDEVAIWERALDTNEIWFYMTNSLGVQLPGATPPLRITSFKADLALQNAGEANVLRWEVSPDVTKVEIDQGVGDVTANTVNGIGSISVAPTETLTYKLTIQRGVETLTATTTIKAVGYAAPGWLIIDGFDQCTVGPLVGQNNWETVVGGIYGGTHIPIRVWQCIDGNQIVSPDNQPFLSGCWLRVGRPIELGESNTLFFRFYIDPAINQFNDLIGGYPGVNILAGIGDVKVRGFVASAEYGFNNNGPSIRIVRQVGYGAEPGPIDLQATWGPYANQGIFSLLNLDGFASGLKTGVVYNVWVDVLRTNDGNIAAYYSVTLQEGSLAPIMLFTNQPSDRAVEGDGNAGDKPFNHVFILAPNEEGYLTNTVRFDDFYLSASGYRTDTPVPARSFVTGTVTLPPSIAITSVRRVPAGVELRWSSVPGAYYTIERRSAVVGGGWLQIATGVASGGATTTWVDTNPPAGRAFYRIKSP